jgi:hypothetical protein
MTAFVETIGSELQIGNVIHLDGAPRTVLDISSSDVTGHRNVHFEGFTSALHIADHWEYSRYV